jgi:hypothetical protein
MLVKNRWGLENKELGGREGKETNKENKASAGEATDETRRTACCCGLLFCGCKSELSICIARSQLTRYCTSCGS